MRKTILLCLIAIIGCSIVSGLANSSEKGPNPAALPAVETKKDDGPILGQAELYYLRQALRCIKMTPQDLLYKKNRDPEMPYRLKCVDNMMANPIDVPFYTDNLAMDISKQQNKVSSLILRLESDLDLEMTTSLNMPLPDDKTFTLIVEKENIANVLKQVDELPKPLKEALSVLLIGMRNSGGLIKTAFSGLSDEGKKNLAEKGDSFEVYQEYESVSREKIIAAGYYSSMAVEESLKRLSKLKSELGKPAKEFGLDETRVKGGILFYAKTAIGEVIIGDRGPNEYNGDFSLIIDLGGDDKYTGRAGGTDGRTQPPVAICLDLGNGNNEFIARLAPEPVVTDGKDSPPKDESDKLEPGNDRIDFCQGGALAGIGILVVDGDGNNTFTAGDWSQGAAHLGVGILLRTGQGNDSYKALDCVQGAASFGIGILQDEQGDDRYRGTFASQGFGGPAGVGMLNDRTGNDNYYAGGRYEGYPLRPKGSFIAMSQGFGYGLRPSCSGGMGILIDNSGNDYYLLHNQFGIGGSYWYAFGMFVDDSGDDVYQTGNAGDYDGYTMGAAIHLAAACMIDRAGNDKYHGNKIGPAVGWDLSPAWLIDGGGTDEFTTDAERKWNWIGGVQNGCGFLVKKSGLAKFDCLNFPCGQICRDTGSIGILLNLGGNGQYNIANLISPVIPPHEMNKPRPFTGMKPGVYWSGVGMTDNNTWCAGIDVAVPPDFKADENLANWPRREVAKPKKEEPEPPMEGVDKITPKEPITATITAEELDKLWVACVTEQGANWDKSFVARDKFKALGPKMLYYVIPELASENYNESGWASAFIAAQGKVAVPALLEHLKLKDKGLRRAIIMTLGDLADPSATEALLPFLQHPGLVDITCMSLGKLKDKRAVPALLKLADNKAFKESEGLRKLLAVALGNIADAAAVPHLIKALDEEYFWVRYPAEQALIQIGEPSVPALLDVVKANRFPASAHAIEALGRIKSKDAKVYDALVKGLDNTDWAMRGFAVEALGDLGNTTALTVFDTLKRTEKHPFVLNKIEWSISNLTPKPPAPVETPK
ncbi:MAG: HEAT repeat domain-containing protein [Planctomycetes bacterium]|nr:HEAT repeat domain-containing protein [Planctomycetota bacterium]